MPAAGQPAFSDSRYASKRGEVADRQRVDQADRHDRDRPRARSSMSFLGRTIAPPWASRSSTSSPDSRTTKPSKVRPSTVANFWGSNPWAILALGFRIDSISSARLYRVEMPSSDGPLAASPGATVWQAMQPCRWKSRSPSRAIALLLHRRGNDRLDTASEAIVGPRSRRPRGRGPAARRRSAAAAFTSGSLSARRLRTWKAYSSESVRPIARSRLAACCGVFQAASIAGRPRPRVAPAPSSCGQGEQHGVPQLATGRVLVLGRACGSRRRAAHVLVAEVVPPGVEHSAGGASCCPIAASTRIAACRCRRRRPSAP